MDERCFFASDDVPDFNRMAFRVICPLNSDGFFRVNGWFGLVDIPDRRRSPVQPLKGSLF